MDEQLKIDRQYLDHHVRNNTVKIQGCLREIEDILKSIDNAIKTFEEALHAESHRPEHTRNR